MDPVEPSRENLCNDINHRSAEAFLCNIHCNSPQPVQEIELLPHHPSCTMSLLCSLSSNSDLGL
jgi:hypothetical protein